ncbi:MAG TPA: diacylglycerol kinase family protein [Candidatus Saccharimonadales bacterium]
MSPFDYLITLRNPHSTHTITAKNRIEQIKHTLHVKEVIDLELHAGEGKTTDVLLDSCRNKLGPRTLLCIAGGDGTVNSVLKYLMTEKTSKTVQQTVLLPLWGGNANDLAHMLNGAAYKTAMADVLDKGQRVAIRPLCCELTALSGERTTYIASSYIGFGASAMAARRFNTLLHRNSKWHKVPGGRTIRETFTVLEAFVRISAFHITENGKTTGIYERIYINGSRIAKVRPLPLKLTDDAFYRLTIKEKRLRAVVMYLRELFRRPEAEQASQEVSFVCEDRAWGQADGETFRVSAGTKVRIYRRKTPFYALSTRLPKTSS